MSIVKINAVEVTADNAANAQAAAEAVDHGARLFALEVIERSGSS